MVTITFLLFLVKGALVACDNSSKSITLSNDQEAVELTLKAVKAHDPSIFTRKLHVDMAYHSRKSRHSFLSQKVTKDKEGSSG